MSKPIKPYIGITDFMTWAQVEQMVSVFRANLQPGSNRLLGVGVMMSYKTLNGIETEWSKAFPPKELVASILGGAGTFNCLHYADYAHREGFRDDLTRAIYWGGPFINAIQLDMTWPNPNDVQKAVEDSTRYGLEIILQIGRKAFELADNDPDKVLRFVEKYQGIIHRVLLDKSVGRGIPMKVEKLLPFVRAIKKAFPDLGLVVAGGLGPTTTHLVVPIVDEFPDISIDAQGKLRPSGNAMDPIDWNMAGEYLVEALKFIE